MGFVEPISDPGTISRRAARVRLENAEFVELIVGCEDPESVARQLRSRP